MYSERQIVLLSQEPELDTTYNETVIFMREGSISSTPLDSESGSETCIQLDVLEPAQPLKSFSGMKPHSVVPHTNLFEPLKNIPDRVIKKPNTSNRNENQKIKDNFIQHRSLLRKNTLTKKLRAATTSTYSYEHNKAAGV